MHSAPHKESMRVLPPLRASLPSDLLSCDAMTSLMWSSWFRLTQSSSGSSVQLQNGHFQFQNALHSQVYSGTTQVSRSVLTSIPWPGTLTSYPPSLLRQLVNKTQQKLRGEISINIYTHYGWNVGATGETWHHKYVN